MANPGSDFNEEDADPDLLHSSDSELGPLGTTGAEDAGSQTREPDQPHSGTVTRAISEVVQVEGEHSEANSSVAQETSVPTSVSPSRLSQIQGPLLFEELPDKVIVKILKLVPREELDELRSVSSQFRVLIDGQIGLSITIGSSNDNFLLDGSVDKLKSIGVSSCTVINLVNTRVPDKPFRHPHLLHSLTLQGYISEKNFLRLIATTPNVETLQIDISTLSIVEFQDINLQEYFPKLDTLRITCEKGFYAECTSTQWLTACYSLIGLLQGKHLNLHQFSICIPYISKFRDMSFDFQKVFYAFLQRHGSTLKKLTVEYDGFYEDIEGEDDDNGMVDGFPAEEVKVLNLESLAISLSIDEDDAGLPRNPERMTDKLTHFWMRIINLQKNLKSCCVCNSIFFPTYAPHVVSNSNRLTLNILHWKFQKQDNQGSKLNVNCIIFRDCHQLTELVLSGPTEEDLPFLGNGQAWWTRPRFTNIFHFPQSLQKIKLDCCEVATSEFAHFPTQYPNLQCLSLDTCCHDPNGINVDTLAGLLEKESLKLLIVQKSFNSKTLNAASNPETRSPIVSIIKALLSAWRLNTPLSGMSTFALQRNNFGQWENAAIPNLRRDMFPTPRPEGVQTMAVLPLGPVAQRRVMFDI